MTSIGVKIWERFKLKVDNDPNLAELKQSCNAIDARINELRYKPKDDTVHWLSAMHAVYDSNKSDVKRWLQAIHYNFAPDTGFLTTHRRSAQLLSSVSPFKADFHIARRVTRKVKGTLPKTTKCRRDLMRDIEKSDYPYPLIRGFIVNYLKGDVSWERQLEESAIHIYTRR